MLSGMLTIENILPTFVFPDAGPKSLSYALAFEKAIKAKIIPTNERIQEHEKASAMIPNVRTDFDASLSLGSTGFAYGFTVGVARYGSDCAGTDATGAPQFGQNEEPSGIFAPQ